MTEDLGIDTNTVCRRVRDYRKKHGLPSHHEERMVRLNPFYERYYLDYFMITSHYALLNLQQDTADSQGLIQAAKDDAQHLIDMSPWEYDSFLAVANFYMTLGQIVEGDAGFAYIEYAADFMAEKIEFTPTGLALRTRYAEALAMLGEIDAAREQLVFVVEHDSNHLSAAEMLQRMDEDPRSFMMLP